MRVSISPYQYWFLSVILIVAIVVGVKWYPCGFDWHFHDNEWHWESFHMPLCYLYTFFKKCIFKSSTHFYIGLFVFYCILRILYTLQLLIRYMVCKYFLPFCGLFDDSHSDRCKVIRYGCFNLHFSKVMLSIFSCTYKPSLVFFGKMFSFSFHFLIRLLVFCFSFGYWVWVVWDIFTFWILTPFWSYHLQISSPVW